MHTFGTPSKCAHQKNKLSAYEISYDIPDDLREHHKHAKKSPQARGFYVKS